MYYLCSAKFIKTLARMVESVDTRDLKSLGPKGCVGSSPTPGTVFNSSPASCSATCGTCCFMSLPANASRSNLILCIRLAPLVGREHFVGQPRRARGDDEASVARSAARGAYRHHHSTQHCAKRAAIYAIMCNDYLHRLHRGCNCTKLHPLLSGQNSIEAVIAPFNFKLSTTLLSTGES